MRGFQKARSSLGGGWDHSARDDLMVKRGNVVLTVVLGSTRGKLSHGPVYLRQQRFLLQLRRHRAGALQALIGLGIALFDQIEDPEIGFRPGAPMAGLREHDVVARGEHQAQSLVPAGDHRDDQKPKIFCG